MADDLAVTPPVLFLPPYPLAHAEECVAQARRAVAEAERVEWASAAASRYRAELESLGASMAALAAAVEHARDRLASARTVAYTRGQL